jgi:hypothetical protein
VAQCGAHPEHDESLFEARMIWVIDQQRGVIEEYRLCFLERNAMLASILGVLSVMPLEPQVGHEFLL